MYYHFYIKYLDLNKKTQEAYVENESSLDMIQKNFIQGFHEAKQFIVVSGSVVRIENIETFRVLKSEKTLDQITNEVNASVARGIIMVYHKTDILSGHNNQLTDITNELI